jgi:hypothetical protein
MIHTGFIGQGTWKCENGTPSCSFKVCINLIRLYTIRILYDTKFLIGPFLRSIPSLYRKKVLKRRNYLGQF